MSLLSASTLLLSAVSAVQAYDISTVTEHCGDIWNFTGDAGLETIVEVTNVTYVAANGSVPAYCSVTMYANEYTGIEMVGMTLPVLIFQLTLIVHSCRRT